jgi:hypothetical protein
MATISKNAIATKEFRFSPQLYGLVSKPSSHEPRDVLILAKPEIRIDIREIQRSTIDDSDSECSVHSEDVLDCRNDYPVKPRKAPRWSSGGREIHSGDHGDNEAGEKIYDVANVENTLNYLNNVISQKNSLWKLEVERERIDQERQSYQSSVITNVKRISSEQKEEEGYYRVLQAAYIRALLLQSARVKQTTMVWDVLNALKRRKSSIEAIDEGILKLKTQFSNSSGKTSSKNARSSKSKDKNKDKDNDDYPDGSTNVLCVTLNGSKDRDVYLYRGQSIATSMGNGCVEQIFPSLDKVVIRLSFGLMYSSIRRTVCWGLPGDVTIGEEDGLDVASDRALCLRWKTFENPLTMEGEVRRGMNEALNNNSGAKFNNNNNNNSNNNNNNSETNGKESLPVETSTTTDNAIVTNEENDSNDVTIEESSITNDSETVDTTKTSNQTVPPSIKLPPESPAPQQQSQPLPVAGLNTKKKSERIDQDEYRCGIFDTNRTRRACR